MSAGTVRRTLLFTDIESSTRLWDEHPDDMLTVLRAHDDLLVRCIEAAGGIVVKHTGDGCLAVFPSPAPAVDAAVAAQRELVTTEFPGVGRLKVRMGVHTGEVIDRDGDLHGWAVNVAARLHALAHGGQVVVSGAAQLEADRLTAESVTYVDMGMHRLRDVAEPVRVYTVVADGIPGHFTDLRGAAPVAALPRARTSFIGRRAEVARLTEQVVAHSLVTLVGLAGVGKTRLALETAAGVTERFADGVVLCEFAGVAPAQVGAVVGKALGVERRTLRSVEESVVEWLRDRSLLLVLDNCEDAPEAVAEFVAAVESLAPACHVLATSREPLGVPGERLVPLQPLATVGEGDAAVELFFERARVAGADLVDDGPARDLVAEICRAVAGIPLAIEIAASNAPMLSLRDILEAVQAGDLPAAGRTAGRHRSIDDALDLTVDRLEPGLRDAFFRSSMLPGSFDRAAFADVVVPDLHSGQVLGTLRELTDRSLLVSETRSDRTRFRLLEPVRRYAAARLGADERAEVTGDFVAHYVSVSETAADALRGPEEKSWVARIDLDFDNVRAAQSRALAAGDADAALRIVVALWDYAFMRLRSEIFDWGEAVCAAAPPSHPGLAELMGVVALGGWMRDDPAQAERWANEALRLERDRGARRSIPARLALLNSAEYGGSAVDVRTLMREVNELSAESASAYWQASADVNRSLGQSFAGRADAATELADRAMTRARDSGNPSTVAWALLARGVAAELVDVEYAESLLDDALRRARSVDNRWIAALCTTRLVSVRRRSGAVPDAMTMVLELFDTWERAGHRSHLWSAVRQGALCLADAGDAEGAIQCRRAASTARLQLPGLPTDAADLDQALARIRSEVGDDTVERWARRVDGFDQADAIRFARERLDAAIDRLT